MTVTLLLLIFWIAELKVFKPMKDDFQEWTEEDVNDLVEYIKKNCADGEHKGGDTDG